MLLKKAFGENHMLTIPDVQNEDVLFKDAVYAAMGMSAAIFKDDVDFDSVLANVLIPEVQKHIDGSNILRRRIAIFVGQWVLVKVSNESRPLVYQLFEHLLKSHDGANDDVVRITAGQQFKNVVDDFEFDAKQFMPHADGIVTKLIELIEQVESTATRLGILETISAIIERSEHRVSSSIPVFVTVS